LLSDYLSRVNETEDPDHPWLTAREKEILHLLAEGYSNNEIAEQLVISPSTVHTHRSNLMQKLNLNSRHELIRYARRRVGQRRRIPSLTPPPMPNLAFISPWRHPDRQRHKPH
jgi:DNA-binding NarL/FixJ family response regulator